MIFLDEIGNLSREIQTKLLRLIQFNTIERVGEVDNRKVDVQIIAATNKDTENNEIFALDLKDRFDEIIEIPPLRERKDDIPELLDHFITLACNKYNYNGRLLLDDDILIKIMDFHWPGNIRQLQKFVEKLVRKFGSREIKLKDIPGRITGFLDSQEYEYDFILPDLPLDVPVDKHSKEYEKAIIQKARSMVSKASEVDQLLCQKDVEKNRRFREKNK